MHSPHFCTYGQYYVKSFTIVEGIFPDQVETCQSDSRLSSSTKQRIVVLFINYRLISLLPIVTIVFLKSCVLQSPRSRICWKIRNILLLSVSASLPLIHLINKTISQHETIVGVFLGLSKAFDTVLLTIKSCLVSWNITVLVGQLCSGLKAIFLNCRQQSVQFNLTCSLPIADFFLV